MNKLIKIIKSKLYLSLDELDEDDIDRQTLFDAIKGDGNSPLIISTKHYTTEGMCLETGKYQVQCESCPNEVCTCISQCHESWITSCHYTNCVVCKKIICRECMNGDSELEACKYTCSDCVKKD